MRADMSFLGDHDAKIVASVYAETGPFAMLSFRQDGSTVSILVPSRMASCLETIARVFNECMDAKPQEFTMPDPDKPDTPQPTGGQYIGLTRESPTPWDTEIGGLTPDGKIRTGVFTLAAGGVLIVTAEVAMQATKFGWELAPEHPTSGDLVEIKR